eukprot:583341-Pyramimonas_sp.AAC.1
MVTKKVRNSGRLSMPGPGGSFMALSDVEGVLPQGERRVVSAQTVYTGPVVLWRCPSHLSWNLELHSAVPMPTAMKVV